MNFSSLTKPVRRAATVAATFAALCLTAACGGQTESAPPVPSAPAPFEQAADTDTGNALRESFQAAAGAAPWAAKVTKVELDGRGVIVTSTLTKADKETSMAICEAALEAAKESKTDFQSVAVRSADGGSTLAHQNEKYGPAACEN